MAKFLILSDYVDAARSFKAGDVVDDTIQPIAALDAAGLAFVPYDTSMDAMIAKFRAQRAIGTQPDLTLLAPLFTKQPRLLGIAQVDGSGFAVPGGGYLSQQGFPGFTTIGVGIYDLTTAFTIPDGDGGALGGIVPGLLITTAFFSSVNGPNGAGEMEVNRTGPNVLRVTTFRADSGALDDAIFQICVWTIPVLL